MNSTQTPKKNESLPKSISQYLVIAYIFSWLVWLPGLLSTYGLVPPVPWQPLFAIGACGPLVAAVWCLYGEGGWAQVKTWLKRGFSCRFGWQLWLLIIITPFIIPPLVLVLFRLVGGEIGDLIVLDNPWVAVPAILLMVTIGGGQEEYGWRGYLVQKLDARWRPWQVDLFLIPIHAFWHLPLFFIAYTFQSQYPFWLFLLFGIGFTPLINWIYRRTGGSILAAILFHGLVNAGLDLFPSVGPMVNHSPLPLLFIGIFFGLVTMIITLQSTN